MKVLDKNVHLKDSCQTLRLGRFEELSLTQL